MSTIPELIKLIKHESKFDEVQNILIEREWKMKIEMGNLVRECDLLRKEVDFLGRSQGYTDLEKCSLEEKLRRSGRRCEELDKRIVEMGEKIEKLRHKKLDVGEKLERSRVKCEELRRENFDANQTMEVLKRKEIEADQVVRELQRKNDELRVKMMESDKAAEVYKSRLDDLEPMILKVEEKLAKVLSVNLANLVGAMDKSAAAAEEDLPDFVENRKVNVAAPYGDASSHEVRATSDLPAGSGGIGLPKKGVNYQKISCRCDLKIINVIKKNLQKENLKRFEQSCFGHLLKINELRFQGQLMVHLLLHMDMGASKKKRLVFKINNSNMEFRPSDFFLITGLHFGTLEATKTSSSIHEDVFEGRPSIMLKDVENAFLTVSRDHEGRGELVLKLALLYFLYGTLLVRTRCSRKIDLQYIHIVEDLQKFNAFPWGQVAYQFLVSSIMSVRVRMDGSKSAHFDMHGFSYALQAWVYEVMPSVATYCASRANNFENLTPHILRWSATKLVCFDELNKFFTPDDKTHLVLHNIQTSPEQKNTTVKLEELLTDTIPQAARPLSRSQQKKRKLHCDKDQMPHAVPTSEPSSTATPNRPHHFAHRLSRAEDTLESLLRKFDQPNLDISCDDLPRNESARVEDAKAMKKAEQPASVTTLTRHSTFGPNPISMNDATYKHAKLDRSLAEIERVRALFELAIENSALDTPHLLWKPCSDFEISESEYESTKALYERLLSRTKHLKLWFSFAKFEAFAMKEEALQESGLPDKRKCLQRARAVFERALCYFRTSAPDLKEERAMLLEEWLNMENNFNDLGDVDSVLAKLPKKIKRIRHIETEDGPARYEEYIDYLFPEEARATNLKSLEAAYKWKNGTNKAIKVYDRRARSEQQRSSGP